MGMDCIRKLREQSEMDYIGAMMKKGQEMGATGGECLELTSSCTSYAGG